MKSSGPSDIYYTKHKEVWFKSMKKDVKGGPKTHTIGNWTLRKYYLNDAINVKFPKQEEENFDASLTKIIA